MLWDVGSCGHYAVGVGELLFSTIATWKGPDVMDPRTVTEKCPEAGFTLIETLVVVSTIALLLTILLGALGAARERAKTAVCLQHQKSLFMGLFMYNNKYGRLPNTHLPVATHAMPATGWWYSDPARRGEYGPEYPENYHPGLSVVDQTSDGRMWFWQQQAGTAIAQDLESMSCPASRATRPRDTGNPDQRFCGHYGSGVTLMRKPPEVTCREEPRGQIRWDQDGWQSDHVSMKIDQVREPASVALLWDCGQAFASHQQAQYPRGYAWYVPGYWRNRQQPFDDAGAAAPSWERIREALQSDAYQGRHPNDKLVLVYVDGHAGDITADSLVDGRGDTELARERAWRIMWYERKEWIDDYYHPR